jgi:hypothetical protein
MQDGTAYLHLADTDVAHDGRVHEITTRHEMEDLALKANDPVRTSFYGRPVRRQLSGVEPWARLNLLMRE